MTGVVLDAVKETIVSRVKQISDGRQVVVTVVIGLSIVSKQMILDGVRGKIGLVFSV